MSPSKRHLDHLPPVPQWRGWQAVGVPFLAAGVVLLRCLGGGVRPVVPAYRSAFELHAGAAHGAGGDFKVSQQGGPAPASSDDSVFHAFPPSVGGHVPPFFVHGAGVAEAALAFSVME